MARLQRPAARGGGAPTGARLLLLTRVLLAAMALGPQLLGHSAFNYALKHVSATMIALAVLGEPVGSTLLAWLMFDEAVSMTKLGGMALLLAGIFLATRSERA